MNSDPLLPGEQRPAPKQGSPDRAAWEAEQLEKARICLESFRAQGRLKEAPAPIPPAQRPAEPPRKRERLETLTQQIAAAYEIEERAALQAEAGDGLSVIERKVLARFPNAELIEE